MTQDEFKQFVVDILPYIAYIRTKMHEYDINQVDPLIVGEKGLSINVHNYTFEKNEDGLINWNFEKQEETE